jgi:glycosyltransferase involved in cell wall biosynthesis
MRLCLGSYRIGCCTTTCPSPRRKGQITFSEMSAPTTVLFLNNYDTAKVRAGWRSGAVPGHHLWGTANLSELLKIEDVANREADRPGWINLIERELSRHRFGGKIGDVDLEAQVWNRRKNGPLVYTGNLNVTQFLAISRRAGLFSPRMVGVCHHVSASPSRMRVNTLRGYDHLISFSTHVTSELIQCGISSNKVTTLGWGPDLHFPGFTNLPRLSDDAPVLSIGKVNRDIGTLIEALGRTPHRARVYARPSDLRGHAIPDSVTIVDPIAPYPDILNDLRSAAVVTIPLFGDRSNGITEMVEAIACARPIIATRSPFFDVDIEQIGCGWWVAKGDVDGWCERLELAMSDRSRLAEMGARGRQWAEQNWNADLFGSGVNAVLEGLRHGS